MVNLSVAVHVDSIDETAVMPEPLEYPDVSGAPEAVIAEKTSTAGVPIWWR